MKIENIFLNKMLLILSSPLKIIFPNKIKIPLTLPFLSNHLFPKQIVRKQVICSSLNNLLGMANNLSYYIILLLSLYSQPFMSARVAADLPPDLSTILIDVLERPSSYEGRKDSPALSIIKSLYLCERHPME